MGAGREGDRAEVEDAAEEEDEDVEVELEIEPCFVAVPLTPFRCVCRFFFFSGVDPLDDGGEGSSRARPLPLSCFVAGLASRLCAAL